VHPGIVRVRNRVLGEAEQAFLDLVRTVDRDAEAAARRWCAAHGLPADCG